MGSERQIPVLRERRREKRATYEVRSGNFKRLQRGWGRKEKQGRKKAVSALRVPKEHVKLNLISAVRSRACFSLFARREGLASPLPFITADLGQPQPALGAALGGKPQPPSLPACPPSPQLAPRRAAAESRLGCLRSGPRQGRAAICISPLFPSRSRQISL